MNLMKKLNFIMKNKLSKITVLFLGIFSVLSSLLLNSFSYCASCDLIDRLKAEGVNHIMLVEENTTFRLSSIVHFSGYYHISKENDSFLSSDQDKKIVNELGCDPFYAYSNSINLLSNDESSLKTKYIVVNDRCDDTFKKSSKLSSNSLCYLPINKDEIAFTNEFLNSYSSILKDDYGNVLDFNNQDSLIGKRINGYLVTGVFDTEFNSNCSFKESLIISEVNLKSIENGVKVGVILPLNDTSKAKKVLNKLQYHVFIRFFNYEKYERAKQYGVYIDGELNSDIIRSSYLVFNIIILIISIISFVLCLILIPKSLYYMIINFKGKEEYYTTFIRKEFFKDFLILTLPIVVIGYLISLVLGTILYFTCGYTFGLTFASIKHVCIIFVILTLICTLISKTYNFEEKYIK